MAADKKIPVGLQLYSLKDDCAGNLEGTVAKVAKMGYAGVEFAGYFDRSAKQVRKMLDDNGLACCGTHIKLQTLLGDELKKTVDFNLEIGNPYLIVPGLPEENRSSIGAWKKTGDLFNTIAGRIRKDGLRVGYHNHTVEFAGMEGLIPYNVFFSATDKDVIMQLDAGNAAHGGGNVIATLKKYPGRTVTFHCKEYSAARPDAFVGEGDIPWSEAVKTCAGIGGTEWFIIEYERPRGTPVENVKVCLDNFTKILKTAGIQP